MLRISGVIVAFNEDKVIRKALESLKKFTSEIILFDSFSTDTTLEIAKEFDCKIHQHEFDNHRNQKNRAIEKCSNEWVFLLDSDEYLEDKLINNLENLINNKDGIDAFAFPRKNYIDGDGPQGYPDVQVRLFKNYVRHHGHPFHHKADGNAKKCIYTLEYGHIIHEKTLSRQEYQNRLYYSLRPQDYKVIPNGIEGVIIDEEAIKNPENVNVYKDFILKNNGGTK